MISDLVICFVLVFFFFFGESVGTSVICWACHGLGSITIFFFFKFEGVPNFVIEGVPNTEKIYIYIFNYYI